MSLGYSSEMDGRSIWVAGGQIEEAATSLGGPGKQLQKHFIREEVEG